MEHRKLGIWGEWKAKRYLKRKGYRIVATNWRCPMGEVDLIVERGDTICFVEVKTRSTDRFGAPKEAVDQRRQQRYIRSAKFFYANREMDKVVRFDVLEIYQGKINYIENAFSA